MEAFKDAANGFLGNKRIKVYLVRVKNLLKKYH
jgi:hypothetical protein